MQNSITIFKLIELTKILKSDREMVWATIRNTSFPYMFTKVNLFSYNLWKLIRIIIFLHILFINQINFSEGEIIDIHKLNTLLIITQNHFVRIIKVSNFIDPLGCCCGVIKLRQCHFYLCFSIILFFFFLLWQIVLFLRHNKTVCIWNLWVSKL